jgi:hypothetical protein
MARPNRPAPHPPPPADLSQRALPLVALPGPWVRSYRLTHDPLYFGRAGTERFDAPDGSFGVCYAGMDNACAFIETFGHATGHRVVTASELAARGRARLSASRPLRLVDLTGAGLARLGADNVLAAGLDYQLSQTWAAALWGHPTQSDGLLYRARYDPSLQSVALFDRAAPVLTAEPRGGWFDRDYWPTLAHLLDRYDLGLIDDRT